MMIRRRRINERLSLFTVSLRACLIPCVAFLALWPGPAAGSTLDRDSDPIVMTESELDRLLGTVPERIVALAYALGWVQVPAQVDERAVNDFGIVCNTDPTGITTLAYCDAGTFMGPDPDPTFDADDELVFMAKDAGDRAPGGTWDPAGVAGGSRVELMVTDPITWTSAYVYLFETDGSLLPAAGADYVDYDFALLSGPRGFTRTRKIVLLD
jgi:hypothetical protein